MIFLIEYDRSEGKIVHKYEFNESNRLRAEEKRLEIEIDLNRKKINHEVVLLEANDESLLRQTHRRYFESLKAIAVSTGTTNTTISQLSENEKEK